MDNRIGTCSLCGGPVVMPAMMVHPVAHCDHCGARAANPLGPVIPMEGGRTTRTTVDYPCTCGTSMVCMKHVAVQSPRWVSFDAGT